MDRHLEERIVSLMFTLGRFVRESSGSAKNNSPSFIQLEMMQRIAELKVFRMKDMAKFLCIKAPSVTHLVEDLVKNKYVKRSHRDKDRRIIKIVLTEKGKQTLTRLYPRRADGLRKVIRYLSPADQKKFAGILEKINGIYKQKINIKR